MQVEYESPDLSEFIAGCAKRFCPYCGTAIISNTNGRPKKLCSDQCRWAFHKRRTRHPNWETEVRLNERPD